MNDISSSHFFLIKLESSGAFKLSRNHSDQVYISIFIKNNLIHGNDLKKYRISLIKS